MCEEICMYYLPLAAILKGSISILIDTGRMTEEVKNSSMIK